MCVNYRDVDLPKSEVSALKDLELLIGEPPIFSAHEDHVIMLDIREKKLEKLPESIGNLFNLKTLNINNNTIRELPDSFSNLTNLESLNYFGNGIRELPNSIGNLSKLKRLDIGLNKIEELPESMKKLLNLKTLSIDYNRIRQIPEFIWGLPELTELRIEGNYLEELPPHENFYKLSLEDFFNFPLVFKYLPNKYFGEENDNINYHRQRLQFIFLASASMRSHYWYYIKHIVKLKPQIFHSLRLSPDEITHRKNY